MLRWKRVACLGFLSWLIPFVSSVLIFPVKQNYPALFSTGMTLVLVITAGGLLTLYFRNRGVSPGEAVLVLTILLFLYVVL
jgi:hypothetical protein